MADETFENNINYTISCGCIFKDIDTPCQKEECDICNYQGKGVEIVINGKQRVIKAKILYYGDLMDLVYKGCFGEEIRPSITYRRGVKKAEGSLTSNKWVAIKDGMIFNVTRTDNA